MCPAGAGVANGQRAYQNISAAMAATAAQARPSPIVPRVRCDASCRAREERVNASGSPATIMPVPSRFRTSPQHAPTLSPSPAIGSTDATMAMMPLMEQSVYYGIRLLVPCISSVFIRPPMAYSV